MMRLWTVVLLLAALPAAVFAQDAPVQDQRFDDETASPFEDPLDQAERERGFLQSTEKDARLAVEAYGKCTAERKPGEAARLLTMDFTTSAYRTGLRLLSQEAQRNCARKSLGGRGSMRSAGLLFAGAMAEALVEADPAPVNARLIGHAAANVVSYAPTDAVALCLARSLPDQVAVLFATTPSSDAETAAARPLLEAVPACANAARIGARVELTVPAVRAVIATAAYRLLAARVS